MTPCTLLTLIFLTFLPITRSKVPALGFNTWNAYACNINEDIIRETATASRFSLYMITSFTTNLVNEDTRSARCWVYLVCTTYVSHLRHDASGFPSVNVDDCWLLKERDIKGELAYDETKFPSGLLDLTNFIHGLGFKAGCAGFAGSLGFELTDAYSFLSWGFDYVKIDNCNSDSFNGTNAERFQRWTDALNTLNQFEDGAMFVYSLVEWQSFDAWTWAPAIANSWRIYDDIQPNWPRIAAILNNASFIGQYTTHYAHNDLDMLEIGNGNLTLAEQRSHFTAWALNKSPLLIGTNLSDISHESLEILKNKEILAISQDEVIGAPLVPFFWGKNPDHTWDPSFPAQYWSGFYGKTNQTAIMYINVNDFIVDLNFTFAQSPHLKADATYAVRDLWAHEDKGQFSTYFFEGGIETHDVRAYLFTECGAN
ncbi:glycoside hydrolase family 27 protein [Ramaria rubella]|nr:glycoside hydrolase family 27 protein [Ramaria rubella]